MNKKTIEEMNEEVYTLIEKNTVLGERNRIMREIRDADLPAGIWIAIKDIINPK